MQSKYVQEGRSTAPGQVKGLPESCWGIPLLPPPKIQQTLGLYAEFSEERRPGSRMQTAATDDWKLEKVYLLLAVMLVVRPAETTLII